MAFVNYSKREVNAKIVYGGPPGAGKITNLQWLFQNLPAASKGRWTSLASESGRTCFFDLIPADAPLVNGFPVRFHLYALPGEGASASSLRLLAKGADGAAFIADLRQNRLAATGSALEEFKSALADGGIDFDSLPLVVQFNWRSQPDERFARKFASDLGLPGRPFVSAGAATGRGVKETFFALARQVEGALVRTLVP